MVRNESWDTLGMPTTASHDLTITDCRMSLDHTVRLRTIGKIPAEEISVFARFSLSVASIYTGIAIAALNFAKQFASDHKLSSLRRPIKYLPDLPVAVAEAETLLAATRAHMFETVKAWVGVQAFSGQDGPRRVYMHEYFATNNAIRFVKSSIEIVGAVGILKKHPHERYYRDVRPGTNHTLGISRREMPRW